MTTPTTYTRTIEGKTFSVELNDWAGQANGSVLVRLGDTVVLATAVMSTASREGTDFFPLTVDYEEKYYATGKILGSRFVKRETRPSEEAILAARLIDRSIRPRFDHRMRNEVQVILTILSIDEDHDPDIPALLAASLALSVSDIPWNGPVAAVRVARKNAALIANPTHAERLESDLDAVVSATPERINMIEAGANEINEKDFADAVSWADQRVKDLIAFQQEIILRHAVKKATVPLIEPAPELRQLLQNEFLTRIEEATYQSDKETSRAMRTDTLAAWHNAAKERFPEAYHKGAADQLFDTAVNDIIHRRIIDRGERPDGRKPDELREIRALIGVIPRVHGSGLFMRGETHVLSSLTLGAPGDEQIVEGMEVRAKRHFLHHYNFPPFSVGEVRPLRGPGRREIGHGALAGKAILPLLPPKTEFPYTIRVVSEALSSNGSTSMASVCGASLALMDGGVPIPKLAAGAAMGLMMRSDGTYRVLTDIQGPEDHHGDMDFKVAGTRDGITAVQMDVKIEGITDTMLRDALSAAYTARLAILERMEAVIKEPRPELSPYAPRIQTLTINPEKIGALIGPGGKVINEIIAKTGVQIDIEDDGHVFITSEKPEGMERAIALIKLITREFKPGELVEGKVTRMFEFGAMVEIAPKQEGLIHISELAPWRVGEVSDIVAIGDVVPVMIIEIDDQGRINLSLKRVPDRYSAEEIEKGQASAAANPPQQHFRGNSRPRDNRRHR